MIISTKGRYALRVMIELANNENGDFIALRDVAKKQEISIKYLELIVSILHKGGMLVSQRGKAGGYKLAKKPSEYTLGSILKLTEGSLAPVTCVEEGAIKCERESICVTLPLWKKLDSIIDDFLEEHTLQDLIDGNI